MKNFILDVIKGILIGVANVIPGVSGGTLAVSTGVYEKIINAMNNILEGKYAINPKILNGKNVSCENCKYKDICYHDEKDLVYLGGDDNA